MPPGPELEIISSAANPRVKALRALERKKARSETGLFLAEGPRLVQQGLDRGWHLDTLAISSQALTRPHIAALAEAAEANGARRFAAPDRVMSKLARKDNPNAVVGAFRQQHPELGGAPLPQKGLWIALYEVRDPGNLGTILRTADCAGIDGVILLETCCDPYSLEAVRASMGSIFDMPVFTTGLADFNNWCARGGVQRTAATMNGTLRHDQVDYGQRGVILMGNEQSGVPETLEAACETLARIPMRGGADSLNLAQATALMVYEAWRQTGFSGARE
ncbi:MAG: RNA methyltransferase [Hyphomonadaceae bacterium]|nr:RNA methyltransferase [Hyphomonadaceae bacterium]